MRWLTHAQPHEIQIELIDCFSSPSFGCPQFGPTDLLERIKIVVGKLPRDWSRDVLVVVPQYVADPCDLLPGLFGCRALSSGGRRRLASEMISTPRSTSHWRCQSASKVSSGAPPITSRIRSIASRMSDGRGTSERMTARTLGWQRLRFAAARPCANYPWS